MKIHLLETELLHADRHDKDNSCFFTNSVNAPKKGNNFWKMRLFLSQIKGRDFVPQSVFFL